MFLGGFIMYEVSAIFLIGFLFYVVTSVRDYNKDVKERLPKISPENRRQAKKYMLIENLLFALAPELAMLGMAVTIFAKIDISDFGIFIGVLVFSIIAFLSIGISGIYGQKVQSLIPKEVQNVSAA